MNARWQKALNNLHSKDESVESLTMTVSHTLAAIREGALLRFDLCKFDDSISLQHLAVALRFTYKYRLDVEHWFAALNFVKLRCTEDDYSELMHGIV